MWLNVRDETSSAADCFHPDTHITLNSVFIEDCKRKIYTEFTDNL